MSVNLHLAFRLQNPTFTVWEIASGHLTAGSLPSQIYLTWRQGEAGLSTLICSGSWQRFVGDSQPQHGQKLTYKKLTSVFKLVSSLTLNNAENKMQADISVYLKGLLKTLNPKTLKSYNCPHSNFKNCSFLFLGRLPRFHMKLWCDSTKWQESSGPSDSSPSPFCFRLGFSSGSDGKESACKIGDSGLIPGWGRSPGDGNGNPLQYS